MLWLLLACGTPSDGPEPEESPLFGAPSTNTGLPDGACEPGCSCLGFTPPSYDAADLAALRQWSLATPFERLESDPYDAAAPDASGVCAVHLETAEYTLQTYPTAADAEANGAVVTHGGACGLCSTLEDLAVYIENPDLTDPVRECGVQGIFGSEAEHLECLEAIGFTPPCAQIWRYNTKHTQQQCLEVCFESLEATHHTEDGALNPCIQCDEDESGPVFKAVSGRTRRNSGLPSALCRPCETVFPVTHRY